MGVIQKFHGFEIHFSAFKNEIQCFIEIGPFIRKFGKSLMNECIYGIVFPAQYPGVIHICGNAPNTEQKNMLEGENVRICGRVRLQSHFFALIDHFLQSVCRRKVDGSTDKVHLATGCPNLFNHVVS
jgi:hypothetical protein